MRYMLKTNSRLIFSLLFSLFLACYVQHRVFFDLTAINDDIRNQIYWMARLIDPSLFPNDFIASYFTQNSLVSPVLYFLYKIAANWIDPVRFSQFIPFILVLISTFLLFKIAETYSNSHYAFWVTYIFNLFVWKISNLSGGLPRSFFYPFMFLFLWFYITERWIWLIPCFCLQCLIYPPIFFLSVGMVILELFLDRKKSFQSVKISYVLIAITIGLFVLYCRYSNYNSNDFGSLTTLKEALSMPEFYLDGRIKAFPLAYKLAHKELFLEGINNLLIGLHHRNLSFFSLCLLSLFFALIAIFFYKKDLFSKYCSIPRWIWSLSVASIIIYFLALIASFYLYLPQRYIQFGLPILLIFLSGSILYQFTSSSTLQKRYKVIVILCLLLISSHYWIEDLISIGPKGRNVLDYLKSVPKNALIAAPLKLADDIPAFSHRSILISYEANIPFHKKYYTEISSRIKDWNGAYYSNNSILIKDFVKKYNVDYLVIDQRDFQGKNSSLTLSQIPEACKLSQFGRYSILPGKKVYPGNCFD